MFQNAKSLQKGFVLIVIYTHYAPVGNSLTLVMSDQNPGDQKLKTELYICLNVF